MTCDYMLKIHCSDEKMGFVSQVLEAEPTETEYGYWGLGISEKGSQGPIDYVGQFLELLGGKFERLMDLGVARGDISVWVYCEYLGQCGLEFPSDDLMRLGVNGLDLCISCWETVE